MLCYLISEENFISIHNEIGIFQSVQKCENVISVIIMIPAVTI